MTDVIIPDFTNAEDFNRFVATQKDEDIQAWKTADWNNLYDKLDKIVEPENRHAFASNEGKDSLIKLNSNYRLEQKDMECLRETSKKIAKNIITALEDSSLKITSINTDNSQLVALRKYFGQIFDKAVYDAANYKDLKFDPKSGKRLSDANFHIDDYETTKSDIKVEDREQGKLGGQRSKDIYSSTIKLTTSTDDDHAFTTAVHELIHAHFQTLTTAQKLASTVLSTNPINGMSEGFYKLLRHNDEYYVSDTQGSHNFQHLKKQHENGDISDAEYRKQELKNFKGYSKQPLETHAEVMALLIEHYSRQETQQYSERAERAFVNLVGVKPTAVTDYNGTDAMLIYQNNPDAVKRFDIFKQYMNPDVKANIGLFKNTDHNSDVFVIPKKYSVTKALRCAEKNVRIALNLINVSQCSAPIVAFDENNCIFYYTPENAQKIQDVLQKHTNDKTAEIKFDTNGSIRLPQDETKLNNIIKRLHEIKAEIENAGLNKQNITQTSEQNTAQSNQNQIERIRNRINNPLQSVERSADTSTFKKMAIQELRGIGVNNTSNPVRQTTLNLADAKQKIIQNEG